MLSGIFFPWERVLSHRIIELEALELIWFSPPAGWSLRGAHVTSHPASDLQSTEARCPSRSP